MPNTPAVESTALPTLSNRHAAFIEAYFACNMNAAAAGRAMGYKNHSEGYRLLQREDVSAHISARMAQYMSKEEVLQRLTALGRVSGEDFIETLTREVPVFEQRPLELKIANLQRQVNTLTGLGADLHKGRIAGLASQITDLETQLALDPVATYQVQVGTRTEEYEAPSLEAGRRSGKLFAVKKVKYGKDGIEFEWQTAAEALALIGKHHKLFTERVEMSGNNGGPVQVQVTRRIVSTSAARGEE